MVLASLTIGRRRCNSVTRKVSVAGSIPAGDPMRTDPVVVAICLPMYKHPTIQFWRSLNAMWRPYSGSSKFPPGSATYTFDQVGHLIEDARNELTDDALRAHEAYPGNPKVT